MRNIFREIARIAGINLVRGTPREPVRKGESNDLESINVLHDFFIPRISTTRPLLSSSFQDRECLIFLKKRIVNRAKPPILGALLGYETCLLFMIRPISRVFFPSLVFPAKVQKLGGLREQRR